MLKGEMQITGILPAELGRLHHLHRMLLRRRRRRANRGLRAIRRAAVHGTSANSARGHAVVTCTVDLPHAPLADQGGDVVVPDGPRLRERCVSLDGEPNVTLIVSHKYLPTAAHVVEHIDRSPRTKSFRRPTIGHPAISSPHGQLVKIGGFREVLGIRWAA